MRTQHARPFSRRRFLGGVTLAWTARLLGLPRRSVAGAIEPLAVVAGHRLAGDQPLGHPGVDRDEAVGAAGPHGAAPERADPASAAPVPGAVRGTMGGNARRQCPLRPLVELPWQVVDARREDVGSLLHAQSCTPSGISLQSWANRQFGSLPYSDEVWLEMHPQDAQARDLCGGMLVRVWNDLGEVHLRLRLTEDVRPGVVCSPKGAWLRTSDNGQTVSALAPSHYADLCQGACYNDTRVEVAAMVEKAL